MNSLKNKPMLMGYLFAIGASIFSFVLWNKSILLIGAPKTGMVYYTLPLFSGVLAWLFLGEDIGVLHLISGLMIVSGIFIANRKPRKN